MHGSPGWIARCARAVVVLAVLGAAARAQCPDWGAGFEYPNVDGTVHDLVAFDDGAGSALYVAGNFSTVSGVGAVDIARWDGTAWTAVGAGTGINSEIYSLAVFDDGTGPALYAGGRFSTIDGVAVNNIARWDGTTWTPLGAGLNAACWTLAVLDDGSGSAIYAGGDFTQAGGDHAFRSARWNGVAWTRLGYGMNGIVHAFAVFDDGSGGGARLYAGGSFATADGIWVLGLAQWDGVAWSGVGGGVSGQVWRLLVHDDGSGPALFVAGTFNYVDDLYGAGAPARSVARWNGTSWSTLAGGCLTSAGAAGTVFDLAVHDDGNGPQLHAAGDFGFAGGSPAQRVARWDGAGWTSVGGGTTSTVRALWSFGGGSTVDAGLYAGGSFTHAAGVATNSVARWDGTDWSALDPDEAPPDDAVHALVAHDDGSGPALYAAGRFQSAGGGGANRIARWRDGDWSTLGLGLEGVATSLCVHDDGNGPALYAGGGFTSAGGAAASRVARWNGVSWSSLGTGCNNSVNALASFDDGSGPALYAGGFFTAAGGTPASRIARWNGAAWSAVGSGATNGTTGTVNAMAVFDDGSGSALYVAGAFLSAGGTTTNRVARWDGTSWTALGSGVDGTVNALAVHDDGTGPALYAGGLFANAGGASAMRIARWNGTAWSAIAGGGFDAAVLTLGSFDFGGGRSLFAGGQFNLAGALPAARIARWDGGAWSALGAGFPGTGSIAVNATLMYSASLGAEPALFVGGLFTRAGDVESRFIARWNTCPLTHADFCAGDGTGAPCPCANESAVGDAVGCRNSFGTSGRLRATGRASLTNDTLLLSGSAMPSSSALYFQGTTRVNAGAGSAFGDGLRCAGGTVLRLGTQTNTAGVSVIPDLAGPRVSSLGSVIAPGLRTYQVWYRNSASFCTPDVFNLTNGVEVAWTP